MTAETLQLYVAREGDNGEIESTICRRERAVSSRKLKAKFGNQWAKVSLKVKPAVTSILKMGGAGEELMGDLIYSIDG